MLLVVLDLPLSAQEGISAQDDYLYAKRLFDEGYYDIAAEQLERILTDFSNRPEMDEAQFLLGECYFLAGNFKSARAAYLRVAIQSPESPRAPEALYKVGASLERMDSQPEAAQSYERIERFYPESPFAVHGLAQALNLYLTLSDSANADRVADLLILKHPRSADSDAARLYLAERSFQRGVIVDAKLFLQRIIERATTDSLAARALHKLGMIQKANWELEAAATSFKASLKRDSLSSAAGSVRLDYARLQNQRRLTDDALKILKPLLSDSKHPSFSEALLVAGDAYFLKNDLTEAFNQYQKSTHPDARIKAAWSAEKAGSPQMALKIYLTLTGEENLCAEVATIRAAQLAMRMKQPKQSTDLWLKVLEREVSSDKTGRVYFEAVKSLSADTSEIIQSHLTDLLNKIRRLNPPSPWVDDVEYLYFQWCERSERYQLAATLADRFQQDYPCSPMLDSVKYGLEFIRRCRLRSQDLVERMAELSSRPQNKVKSSQWASDWGDFYLFDFKDPVKAIDQYDNVLDDVTATTEERADAFKKSVDAYIRLYEIALREEDDVSAQIFGDSSQARLARYEKTTSFSDPAMNLRARFDAINMLAAGNKSQLLSKALNNAKETLESYREERLPVEWLSQYLSTALKSDRFQSTPLKDWLKITETAGERADSDALKARLKFFEARALHLNEQTEAACDTALVVISRWSQTCAGANALWWLASETALPAQERIRYLSDFQTSNPTLAQLETVLRLEAELLELAKQPLQALNRLEQADQISAWGKPVLDFQTPLTPEAWLRRAEAFLTADSLSRAETEFRGLFNSDPTGPTGASALKNLINICHRRRDDSTALSLLDTLEARFPDESSLEAALHFRPRIEFQLERYAAAEKSYQALLNSEIPLDSAYYFSSMIVVCQYRQNKIDKARESTKGLFKQYKDFKNYDDMKARFAFELGLSNDRQKDFAEARKQYESVLKSYSSSAWSDDAAFETALSFIKKNLFESGIPLMIKFLENYPSSELVPEARLNLSLAYIKLEKYNEAIAAARDAWNDTTCQRVWTPVFQTLLTTYKALGFSDAAISLNREYLRRFPNAPDALDRRMDIGQMFLQNGDWDDALRQYRPLLPFADAESEAEIQYYIGEATQGKGDYRGAILEYLKVPILGRKTKLDWGVTALYQSGACYEKLGDIESARRMYMMIIQQTGEASNYGRTAQARLNALPASRLK